MTFEDGKLVPDTEDIILEEMLESAQLAFGEDLNPDDASVIRAFYQPIANYLSLQQELMGDVLDATRLDDAEGAELDRLAGLIGVVRRQATPAKTTLRFARESQAEQSFTIPAGTIVQTSDVDSTQFETDTSVAIELIDDFDSNNINGYSGDSGTFTTDATTTYNSSDYALEAGASVGHIYDLDTTYYAGSKFHVRQYMEANTIAGFTFGVQDADNYYRVVADSATDALDLQVISNGSVDTTESTVQNIPNTEWIRLEVDWKYAGEVVATVYNAAGTSLASVTLSEATATYKDGGIGFYSGDSADLKYWDFTTMTAVGVPATSVESGAENNVSANRLTVIPNRPAGVNTANNPVGASGGTNVESDTAYRERAKEELAEGARATENAILSAVQRVGDPKTVDIIVNDTSSTDGDGRPSHSFEVITDVDSTFYDDVAEAIIDTKAAGDIPVGGYAGTKITRTVELLSGQTKDVDFSVPTTVDIYFDVDLTKDDTYAGDEAVKDSIVQYVGGTLSTEENIGGEISTGDDVVFYQVAEAIMDVRGVHDITNLEVGTSANPTGTTNVSIASGQTAASDATDSSIDVTSSDV